MTHGVVVETFRLADTDASAEAAEVLADASAAEPVLEWIPATAPGEVHAALLAAGRIPHPHHGRNEDLVRWVENRIWWYVATLDEPPAADGEHLRLILHGLDTVAEIWLNGERLGAHRSMFRPAEFDVTDRLRGGDTLLVRLDPPLAGLSAPEATTQTVQLLAELFASLGGAEDGDGGLPFAEPAMTLLRKPTFSWGWDFAPRLPSVGIWRPVELRRERVAALRHHRVHTLALDAENGTARVELLVEAHAYDAVDLSAVVTLTAPDGVVSTADLPLSGPGATRTGATTVTVDRVRPWWTHDLGTPNLYDVQVRLLAGGAEVDRVDARTGLRTIELDLSPSPDGGRDFRFVLNGRPVHARGACWVPASTMLGTVSSAYYESAVALARAGEMTMLRVWGGGIYEDDAFYDACDAEGVLVWQDFAFACVDYPSDDPGLRDEIEREARYQTRRLANRPSLALWAGNNEVQMVHQMAHRDVGPGDLSWGWEFFHEVLPAAVAADAPGVPYWPGSPYGEADPGGINGVADGDRHAWEVWHGFDAGAVSPETYASHGEAMHFRRYRHDTGRFVSEFGICSAPDLRTLERWLPADELELGSPSFTAHIKDKPKDKGDALLAVEVGMPTNLAEQVDLSQAVQAEGMKFGIEHYRRRQPRTGGELVWQFNDPWPGTSWALVDSDLRPKAAFHAAQRAFAPAFASLVLTDDSELQLWFTASAGAVRTTLRVEVLDVATAKVLLDEQVAVEAAAHSSEIVWRRDGADLADPSRVAWVRADDPAIPDNRLLFAPLKDVPWPDCALDLAVVGWTGDEAELEVTAHGYGYGVRVEADGDGVTFDRNHLDVRDGHPVRIRARGADPAAGAGQFRVRTSLVQSRTSAR